MAYEEGSRGFHDRIAVVCDFDLTLSSATVPHLLEHMGIENGERWERTHMKPLLEDGWDKIIAHGQLLARAADECNMVLTRELAAAAGRSLHIFDGVAETLAMVCERGAETSDGAEVELYILSCGFVDIMGHCAIADRFDEIWGSALHWDEGGRLAGVKRTIIHSEKSRYLLALAKGLDVNGADEPEYVHEDKPVEDWYLPLDQVIYVGDGESDIAAFELVHSNGGIAIGVNQSGDGTWSAAKHIYESARVDNLAPPDFRPGREMHESLRLAVESVGKRVALRRFTTRR